MDDFEKGIMKELGTDTPPVEDPNAKPVDLKVDYDMPKVEEGQRDQFDEELIQRLSANAAYIEEAGPDEVVEAAPAPAPAQKPTNLPEE